MVADEPVDVGLYGVPFYFFRDVKGKGVDKHGFCGSFADAAGPEIEQGVFAELTYCGAVAAFYVVGEDLEFGFGVDGRLFADNEVIVLLEGVCFLCGSFHAHLSVEDAGGLFEQDPFIEFVAKAVGLLVMDQGVVVYQLAAG